MADDLTGMDFGAGAMTPEALDALLAAATAESEDSAAGMPWGAGAPAAARPEAPAAAAAQAESVVSLASFDAPAAAAPAARHAGMGRVRDIPLEVTVELGRTRMLIRDILELGTGSIIELDKIAGEPVDLFANGLLVARGEVVVIDDNFGVRVTEIITAGDRQQMKEADALAA